MLTIGVMTRAIITFAIATLTPAVLIVGGAIWGGAWVVAAVIYLTGMTSLLDRLVRIESPAGEADGHAVLSVGIALAHLLMLPVVVWGLTAPHLTWLAKAGLFFAAGLWMGQVSNANAHELIHSRKRGLHRLGMWVYITMLFGHHTSAHVLVHHRHVGTSLDPNTSRKGEGLYRYIIRAWRGSFLQGLQAESARLAKVGRSVWSHPYLIYVGGAVGLLALAWALGGPQAAIVYLALCAYAQSQLLMSDYVQHYGLMRRVDESGRPEPVNARHSWNSPHWFSSALMLNATRHSDHHAHPAKPYPALDLPEAAPMLPRPLPLMASIALIPPLWRRIMDPRVDRWQNA